MTEGRGLSPLYESCDDHFYVTDVGAGDCAECGRAGRVLTPEQPPKDRGCRWCGALPEEWCEEDCGGPSPVLHPEFRAVTDA